jgi:hypothetical protein
MRLLTAGLQVRVLLAEPLDSPHQTRWGDFFWWGSLAVFDPLLTQDHPQLQVPRWGGSSKALSEESEGRRVEGPCFEGTREQTDNWCRRFGGEIVDIDEVGLAHLRGKAEILGVHLASAFRGSLCWCLPRLKETTWGTFEGNRVTADIHRPAPIDCLCRGVPEFRCSPQKGSPAQALVPRQERSPYP